MTLVDAIAEIEELRLWATLAGSAAIGAALALWRLGKQVDRGCPQCPHCQENQRREDQKRKDEAERNLRWMGVSQEEIDKRKRGDRS